MKIIKCEIKGEMIKVTTDDEDTPIFVYFKDQFKNLEEIKTEIMKKIHLKKKKKDKKKEKLDKIKKDCKDNKIPIIEEE